MVIHRGSSNVMKIALTFDDGPNPVYTAKILDTLKSTGARATFFVMGKRVRAYPGVAKAIVADGHDLGNHGFDHYAWNEHDEAAVRKEITACTAAVSKEVGWEPRFFRPPGMLMSTVVEKVADDLGLKIILMTPEAGSGDWFWAWREDHDNQAVIANKAEEIVKNAVDTARAGAIFDLHDGNESEDENWAKRAIPTVLAVPRIIENLQSRGFSLVKLSEMDLVEEAWAP